VNKLSDNTAFRNFAVVDLIRSTKPGDSDDPTVVSEKINYLAKSLSRLQDAALAANQGLSIGLPAEKVRPIITRNFLGISYDEFARQNPGAPMSRKTESAPTRTESLPMSSSGGLMLFDEWLKDRRANKPNANK
jgi:hypothetical protein